MGLFNTIRGFFTASGQAKRLFNKQLKTHTKLSTQALNAQKKAFKAQDKAMKAEIKTAKRAMSQNAMGAKGYDEVVASGHSPNTYQSTAKMTYDKANSEYLKSKQDLAKNKSKQADESAKLVKEQNKVRSDLRKQEQADAASKSSSANTALKLAQGTSLLTATGAGVKFADDESKRQTKESNALIESIKRKRAEVDNSE